MSKSAVVDTLDARIATTLARLRQDISAPSASYSASRTVCARDLNYFIRDRERFAHVIVNSFYSVTCVAWAVPGVCLLFIL